MNAEGVQERGFDVKDGLIFVLVLGSLWGFTEVVLGHVIQLTGFPFRAGLLTGVGFGLMAIAVGALRSTYIPALLGIAVIASLCKQLVVPILGVSPMCKANSCVALVAEGLALGTTVTVLGRRRLRSPLAQVGSAGVGAMLGAGAFYFAGMNVAPCAYLESFQSVWAFLQGEGLIWAAFSIPLFPLGYWVGDRLRERVTSADYRPVTYYVTSAVLVLLSWGASALTIATAM